MKSYIKLVFITSIGKDLTVTISDADEAVTDGVVSSAASDIVSANAIDGAQTLTGLRSASLYKVQTKKYVLA